MFQAKSDLKYLQLSMLTLTASLLACGSAIWLCNTYHSRAAQHLQDAQRQLSLAQKTLLLAQSDLENMSVYATEYAVLTERQIVAEEQRLDWIEGLETLRRQNHVYNLKYTIAPQQRFIPQPALDKGNMEINLSSVSLQMDLLHEMQLLDMFEWLHSEKKGWFILDRCTLERNRTSNDAEAAIDSGTQLKAECTGGWITLKHRDAL
jgi:hypothetical protein